MFAVAVIGQPATPCSLVQPTGLVGGWRLSDWIALDSAAAAHRYGATTNDAVLVAGRRRASCGSVNRGESVDPVAIAVPVSGAARAAARQWAIS